jgi:hypothetical protein
MAADTAPPMMPNSFSYKNLVSHIVAIQNQTTKIRNILYDRWRKAKKVQNQLKSRSLTFVDPYGNHMNDKFMDHELISTVTKTFKKNYVPKYLQEWIKIGTMKQNIISSLTDTELKSPVSHYANDYQFVAYGPVIVWLGNYTNLPPEKLVLWVRLTDNIENITMKIFEEQKLTNIELKFCTINGDAQPNEDDWNCGTVPKPNDTIMACRLYQDTCVIMAKVRIEEVKSFLQSFT